MRVLLIQPPVEDFYDTSVRTYPLGLAYVASRVSRVADVAVLDARTGGKPKPIAEHGFPEMEPFYREGVNTPFSFLGRFRRYGLSASEIREAIDRYKPDVVGIASMCTAYEQQALEVAEVAKEVSREITIVMGGVHPTLFPAHVLRNRNVDYCVRGEGETPFLRLVSSLSQGRKAGEADGIPGVCFRRGEEIHLSKVNVEEDIDLLPNREILDGDRYCIGRKRYAFFLSSRGCPYSCSFCGKPPVPYRKRTLASVEEEIAQCARLGVAAIDFEDDMLNLDKGAFAEVLGLFKDRGFTLSAMNGIYPGNLDVPTLRLMQDAGFRRLNFSLVDMSESVLDRHRRRSQPSFVPLLPFLEDSPFLVEVHFIIGLPGQDPASLLETMLFLMARRLLLGPSIFYLSPGSPVQRIAEEEGKSVPFRFMRSSVMLPFNPLFPRTVTFTFVKLVRFINYVKQALDSEPGIRRMSDLPEWAALGRDPRKRHIVKTLIDEKRFVLYDQVVGSFRDEPVDGALVRWFFDRARGSSITGYKTKNTLVVD